MALHSAEWNRFVKMDGSDMLASFGGCLCGFFRALDRFRYALSDKGFVRFSVVLEGFGNCRVSQFRALVLDGCLQVVDFGFCRVLFLRTGLRRSPEF